MSCSLNNKLVQTHLWRIAAATAATAAAALERPGRWHARQRGLRGKGLGALGRGGCEGGWQGAAYATHT